VVEGDNPAPRKLLEELLKSELVQTCFYHPIPEPASCNPDPAPTTGYWEANQGYRNAAPQGVDIQYAWDYSTFGDGISSYYVQDIEYNWCINHEDMNDNMYIAHYDATESNFGHGAAVLSIMGACDNDFGVTGLVPDCRMTGRNWDYTNGYTYPDVSDAIIETGNYLFAGETYLIEIHAQGPAQSGYTCPCNCGQFRYIAMEYWDDNYDAILTNSANGRICVEAAGNGSMDLDWAIYGSKFDRGFRDSRAVIVGAGSSSTPHEPMCWTNHGSRIDVYGWGENVYAHGYGNLFSGAADCSQDYTYSFSGTSSATPICAGSAASLQLTHYQQFGSYLTPWELRDRLQINGTPQGPGEPTHEIGVMPNLKGILAPDLAPFKPDDWDAEIVPVNNYGDPRTIPDFLYPTPDTTFIYYAWWNVSYYGTASLSQNFLYLDDVYSAGYQTSNHLPGTYAQVMDLGRRIRGGRHYLKTVCDPNGLVDESLEDNQTYIQDYTWNGITIAADTPESFTHGPQKDPEGYSWFACDGFYNGGNFDGFWDVFAVMPEANGDYDARIYNMQPSATSGYTGYAAASSYGLHTDFVGCNNNLVYDGDWFSVINYDDTDEDYTVEGDGSFYLGFVPTTGQTQATSGGLDPGEILDVYEFHATTGDQVWLNFQVTSGDADLAVMIFAPVVLLL